MPATSPLPAEHDEFLVAEYNYIAQTAFQANEDRARSSSFYLVAVGSLIAAMFGTQLFDPNFFSQGLQIMFSCLFALLTLLGTSTIIQLARLRVAWHRATLAMNQIKEYVISQNQGLAGAFLWTKSTIPSIYKPDSVSYYKALEVALISGLMFSAAMFFLQQAFFTVDLLHWIIAALAGGLMVYLQVAIYRRMLD